MVTKPVISPDFTIEDIHKIREYHYQLTKDMTSQEKMDFYNEGGRSFLREMEERKELAKSRTMPITFDEDCPETTPERALRFKRVNPPRNDLGKRAQQ